MTRSWLVIVLAVLAMACEEAETEAATAQPAPVAPVEVTGGEGSAAAPEGDEVAQLRARVAELEQQLAACRGAQPAAGTQTAAIPEGADVPPATPEPVEPAAAATNTQGTTRDAGTRARRPQNDPTLMDTILGDDRRRRRGDDEPIELPNPANILLGQ